MHSSFAMTTLACRRCRWRSRYRRRRRCSCAKGHFQLVERFARVTKSECLLYNKHCKQDFMFEIKPKEDLLRISFSLGDFFGLCNSGAHPHPNPINNWNPKEATRSGDTYISLSLQESYLEMISSFELFDAVHSIPTHNTWNYGGQKFN